MKIITHPDKTLYQVAEPVDIAKISEYQQLIKHMINTVRFHNGLGLASPQVGVSKRIIVWLNAEKEPMVYINPEISDQKGKIKTEEGCLSIPNYRRIIKRSRVIDVEYYDKAGNRIIERLENMDAVIVQHEIDHLNGITILSKRKK
jgi:peptide deformylase